MSVNNLMINLFLFAYFGIYTLGPCSTEGMRKDVSSSCFENNRRTHTHSRKFDITCLAWSLDSREIAVGGKGKYIYLFHIDNLDCPSYRLNALIHPTATELNLLVVAYSCNMYRLAREGMQAYAMRKMLSNWLRNNYLDICSIFAILVVDRMVEVDDQVRTAASFRIVATVAVLLQYLDLISFIKLLNIKFATFVLSLSQIMHDLEFFRVVLGLFMLMFGNAFYVMLSSPLDTTGTDEDDESPPFGTISETFLTVFRMMLGDFERGWFTAESESSRVAPFLITLFVLYMFTVMILLLNMLIAIVSGTLVGQFYSNQYLLILIG